MAIALLVGAAAAGGSYLYAKRKQASTGQSVAVAAASGVATGAATAATLFLVSAMWPVLLIGGVAGGAYFLGRKKSLKALPPSSSG